MTAAPSSNACIRSTMKCRFLRIAPSMAFLFKMLGTCTLILILLLPSDAAELVFMSDELAITRSFSQIVLKEPDIQIARVFVDTERFVVKDTSQLESAELRRIAVSSLGARLQLVQKREDANYIVQLRMEQYKDYAIRNPQREPAHGLVLASICRYPIKEIASDCENREYYYFKNYNKIDIFRKLFDMWLNTAVSSQPK